MTGNRMMGIGIKRIIIAAAMLLGTLCQVNAASFGAGELAVQTFGGGAIGDMGLLRGGKQAQEEKLSVCGYTRVPFLAMGNVRNALEPRSIMTWRSSVPEVLRVSSFSQIREAIVGWVVVDMVQSVQRPLFIVVEPRDAVSEISFTINAHAQMSRVVTASDFISGSDAYRFVNFPRQITCRGVVVEQFSETLYG